MAVTRKDFQTALNNLFQNAHISGVPSVSVRAGDLHRRVGDYPDKKKHRMPICCAVMMESLKKDDRIIHAPPKRAGASLEILYLLPR